jgi:drug/metabolite transporter (DMT)-like permease
MGMHTGELISLGVAVAWTGSALSFEYAGKRMGALSLNVIRLAMSILMLGITLYFFTGDFIPFNAGSQAWFWLAVSGFIGYILGDYCLFSSYVLIGSRFGQLFMTLAPPSAALAGMFLLGERMSIYAVLGMFVTLFGIALSIVGKKGEENTFKWRFKLPLKGILWGAGAGIGQGVGLVFSKLGMSYFEQTLDSHDATALFMLPFASTQIRAVVGLGGFLLIVFLSGKGKALVRSLKDVKGMTGAMGGAFTGPFIGVSFSLMAVQYTGTGIASTIMALTPVMILLPAYYFFKQKITYTEILGAIVSVAGVSLFFI